MAASAKALSALLILYFVGCQAARVLQPDGEPVKTACDRRFSSTVASSRAGMQRNG